MTDKINSPELERRKATAAALADKYCNRDGGKPDLDALADLELIEYGQVRKELAERAGVTVAILDAEVSGRRRSARSAEREYWSVEPADRPVEGEALLKQVTATVHQYVMMDGDQALTVALWIVFAWMHDAAVHSPILLVSSPEAACGKTTLLGLVQLLAPRGMLFVDASPAFYRMVEAWHPTLPTRLTSHSAIIQSFAPLSTPDGPGAPACQGAIRTLINRSFLKPSARR